MKRWKKVVIIIAIIIVVIGITIFAISKVNTETFEEKMIKKGFKITNIIKDYKKEKTIVRATEATEKDNKYKINILEFTSSNTATKYFNKEKERYTKEKDADSAINYTNQNDLERYTITAKNRYIVLYKYNNMIVYYDIDIKYSDEVITLLDELGY